MEMRHVRYFVAVAEELNFRRAAERLAMAQPPLSQQIRDLEAELGVTLFERSHRRVRLTPAGRVFLADARELLANAERATQRVRRAGQGELGRLTIGYTSLLPCPLFPEALRLYRVRFPEVEIVLRDLVTIEQMQQLHTNTLDISFAAYAAFALTSLEEEQLAQECIMREPLAAVVPARHHLVDAAPITLTALANESWIWFARPFDPSSYDHMMRLFEEAGFRPRVTQEVNQFQIVTGLIAAGLGVSLAPQSTAFLANDDVAYVDFAPPPPTLEFSVVWRREDQSPFVRAFLEVVRSIATLPA
jgi:DNA-binding transcriptional LysR family regulator